MNFFKSYHSENEGITDLRSQFVTANYIKKQRFYPYAFTEIGVAMLSSVLKSEVAIQANRKIMKAFVAYRHLAELPLAATYLDLKKQIEDLKTEVNDILADQNDINEQSRTKKEAVPRRTVSLLCFDGKRLRSASQQSLHRTVSYPRIITTYDYLCLRQGHR